MDFSAKQKVNAPASYTFGYLTNFDNVNRLIPASTRVTPTSQIGNVITDGASWHALTYIRGRETEFDVKITEFRENDHIRYSIDSARIHADVLLTVSSNGADASDLEMKTALKSKSLMGRILLQSLRATKSRIDPRVKEGMNGLAMEISHHYENR